MKAYKIGENDLNITTGRLFYQLENSTILLATPKEPTQFFSNFTFERLREKKLVQEVSLLEERWVHPHLYKPVRAVMLAA